MLRNALTGFALLLVLGGAAATLAGYDGWVPAIWGAVVLVCVLFERWRYRKSSHATQANWQSTGEQFIDPETGQAVQVLYDPETGERRYTPVGE